MPDILRINNCGVVSLSDIPKLNIAEFRKTMIQRVKEGWRINSFFGIGAEKQGVCLLAVLANDIQSCMVIFSSEPVNTYDSITLQCLGAYMFECEIAEQWAVLPNGHPCLKQVRFHRSYCQDRDLWQNSGKDISAGSVDFIDPCGEQIHEVAVGPVHAGIIEPGHFRFQCYGEEVLNLQIALGYQHRGIERALIGGPDKKTIHYMETLAGDTTIGHCLAYCQMMEALTKSIVPIRAQVLRAIALELERLANHTGDLGALSADVAYLPTSAYCGRIRGDFLNMTASICGNRFGRGLICSGGTGYDISESEIAQFQKKLDNCYKDVYSAVNLLWDTPSVVDRFEGTGKVSCGMCDNLGVVGVAARACGIERDIRFDFPSGIFRMNQIPVSTYRTGDVFARAYVRWLEIQRSIGFIKQQLKSLPDGITLGKTQEVPPNSVAVSLIEGWRGEICHTAITDQEGKFCRYKIVDPSFHNWTALEMAMRNEQISDFPVCNKSFNLSYCGYDL